MLLPVDHFPERGLTDGVLLAPGLGLVHDVTQDDVEGHLEAAFQLRVVRVTEDALFRNFAVKILETFNLINKILICDHLIDN